MEVDSLIGPVEDIQCMMTDCDELGTEVLLVSYVGTCGEVKVTKPICTAHARMILHTLDGLDISEVE